MECTTEAGQVAEFILCPEFTFTLQILSKIPPFGSLDLDVSYRSRPCIAKTASKKVVAENWRWYIVERRLCNRKELCPGKKVRRDPTNPAWDPDRDFGTSHMGSHLESQVGSCQSHLHCRQNSANPTWDPASNPRWDPSFVPCKIPPSHLATYVCPRRDPAWKILNLHGF